MSAHNATLRGVGRHSAIYGIGSVVSIAAGIVMLPVYTHALTPAEYGILELCLRFIAISMALAFLGLRQGFIRLYYDSTEPQSVSVLIVTTLIANFAMATFAVIPFLGISFFTTGLSQDLNIPGTWPILAALWLAMESGYLVALAFLQVRMRSGGFVVVQAARLILLVGLNYFLLKVFQLGLIGALLGNLLVSLIFGLVSILFLISRSGLSYSKNKLRELIVFGWPYVPTAAISYAMGNADRAVLLATGAITSLGLLSLASKIGEMGLSIFVTPVEKVWAPFAFGVHHRADGPFLIGRLFTQYVALSVLLAVSISLGSTLLIMWFASAEYQSAALLVPLVAFSGVFAGLASLMDIGILIAKKTSYKIWVVTAGALITIALQLSLVPHFGVVGAAVASALGNVAVFFIVRSLAMRHYTFITHKPDFIKIALSGLLALFIGQELQSVSADWSWQMIGAVVGVLIYVIAILAARVVKLEEVGELFRRGGVNG